jgi:hypothetical protein
MHARLYGDAISSIDRFFPIAEKGEAMRPRQQYYYYVTAGKKKDCFDS